ncbi:hypothetical protein ACFLSJ_06690 [Verrucomicrobiota bacterium]
MASSRAKKQEKKGKRGTWRLAKENPFAGFPDAEVSRLWERLRAGATTLDDLAIASDGVIDVTRFFRTLAVVADPLHPANRWQSVVEQLCFGDEVYLRLAAEIPLEVKAYWQAHGHPPRQGWGYASGMAAPWVRAQSSEPSEAGCAASTRNPYRPGTKLFEVFALSRSFRPREEMIAEIMRTVGLTRKKTTDIWWELARPDKNGVRSQAEERTGAGGVREVRLVSLER